MSSSTDTEQTVIELHGVKKAFGRGDAQVHALRGIDLTLELNQLVCLVGPSGCGKTTLISIMSGVLSPDEGSVSVFGTDWSTVGDDERTRRRGELVGFVFQDFNLIPTITAVQNASVPLLLRGVGHDEAEGRAGEMLNDLGLGDRLKARPRELSGGMQQRVAVARALVAQPRMLVCDEPTANLDGKTGQTVMQLIRDVSFKHDSGDQGRCVVVVTHDERVLPFADRVEEMEDGRLKPQPSPEHRRNMRGGGEPTEEPHNT